MACEDALGCLSVLELIRLPNFRSLEEWNTFVERKIRDETRLTSVRRTSTRLLMAGRCINLAADYWVAANLEARNWTTLVNSPELSYRCFHSFFVKDKDTPFPILNSSDKYLLIRIICRTVRSLVLGSRLSPHLLAADCAYALISSSSNRPASLGLWIRTLDMGAHGMRKLSLIKSKAENPWLFSRRDPNRFWSHLQSFWAQTLPPEPPNCYGF